MGALGVEEEELLATMASYCFWYEHATKAVPKCALYVVGPLVMDLGVSEFRQSCHAVAAVVPFQGRM